MKVTYDKKYNIAYIRFREKNEEITTIAISDEVNIDIAPDGAIFSIELLNANEQLYKQDNCHLILENANKDLHSELTFV
jgi:uncharacterized protein YuzE